MKFSPAVTLSLALSVSALPAERRAQAFTKQNGADAIALNNKFKGLSAGSPCNAGETACVGSDFAQCANGKLQTSPCASGEICAALPLVNSAGTSVTCTTEADLNARIQATGAKGGSSSKAARAGGINNAAAGGKGAAAAGGKGAAAGAGGKGAAAAAAGKGAAAGAGGKGAAAAAAGGKGTAAKSSSSASATAAASGGNDQTSLTLDQSVIAKGFEQNGQATQEAGQVASLTSSNNFINFCATTKQPITNGQQVKGGSCNPAPMGSIPSTENMPSAKFQFPKNMDTVQANKAFTVQMNIKGMETGHFVNAQQNYFAAPQQLNAQGQITGHSHIVIEAVNSLTQTTPTDPQKFAFFQGLNAAAQNGVLTAAVTKGLPAGTYRMGSINTAANHQPCLVPVAQHGMLDDAVYFTVTADGKAAATGAAANSTAAAGGASAGTKSTGGQKASGAAGAGNGNAAAGAASAGAAAAGAKAGAKSTGGQKASGAAAAGAKAGAKSAGGQKAAGAAGTGAGKKSGGKNRRWA